MPESGIDARVARRRFDRAARGYAAAARLEGEVGARMLERLDYVRLAPTRILDAGSGPPQSLFRRRYPKAEVVALDFSLGMLQARKRRLLERNAPRAVCADLARLPFAAGTVQLVWTNMALHWVADPLAVLRELYRVLAVDGLLLLSALGPDTLNELAAAAGAARVHRFADMHDIGDLMLAAGFADPVVDAERLTLLYPDEAALLADLRASGQTSARADRPRGLAGRGFHRALIDRLRAQRREDKLGITYEVVYGHAWKAQARKSADGHAVVQFQQRP